MRAAIAKQNLTVIRQAVKHYTDPATQNRTFTFMSFYDDEEPYTLAELLLVLADYIKQLETAYNEQPSIENETALSVWRKRLQALAMLYETQKRKQGKQG